MDVRAAPAGLTVLLLGGTGRTGGRALQQLLARGVSVRAIVRSAATSSGAWSRAATRSSRVWATRRASAASSGRPATSSPGRPRECAARPGTCGPRGR